MDTPAHLWERRSKYSGEVMTIEAIPVDPAMPPRMKPAEIENYWRLLQGARVVVEFGCGGSTMLALASPAQTIYCIENQREWIDKFRAHPIASAAIATGRLRLAHVDLGNTGQWGAPAAGTGASADHARLYISGIWKKLARDQVSADLILVDGRYRVACALGAALACRPGSTVVVHDYRPRSHYFLLAPFFDPAGRVDDMACFAVRNFGDEMARAVRQLFEIYLTDWR